MKKRMESDLLLKIISVVFAFLLWMFVINTDNPVIKKTFSDVPVDMLNEQVLDDLNQTYKIYNKRDRSYFRGLEDQAERLAKENSCPFVDNELPYGRAEPGHPVIVDYFYHEEVRGSENTGRRNPKK